MLIIYTFSNVYYREQRNAFDNKSVQNNLTSMLPLKIKKMWTIIYQYIWWQ